MQVNEKRLDQLLNEQDESGLRCPVNENGEEANCSEYRDQEEGSSGCATCWKNFLKEQIW